jgi:hypothetical protein
VNINFNDERELIDVKGKDIIKAMLFTDFFSPTEGNIYRKCDKDIGTTEEFKLHFATHNPRWFYSEMEPVFQIWSRKI